MPGIVFDHKRWYQFADPELAMKIEMAVQPINRMPVERLSFRKSLSGDMKWCLRVFFSAEGDKAMNEY
jgi:hypothetical protein